MKILLTFILIGVAASASFVWFTKIKHLYDELNVSHDTPDHVFEKMPDMPSYLCGLLTGLCVMLAVMLCKTM